MTRIVLALLMGAVIAIVGISAPGFLGFPIQGWFPSSFVTHTIMLATSLLIMWYLSRGELSSYGFKRGSFGMTPTILLWGIPTSVLSVLQFVTSRSGAPTQEIWSLTRGQTILFVWIYASACEEIFVRGLRQGYLAPLERHKAWVLLLVTIVKRPGVFSLQSSSMHYQCRRLFARVGPHVADRISCRTLTGGSSLPRIDLRRRDGRIVGIAAGGLFITNSMESSVISTSSSQSIPSTTQCHGDRGNVFSTSRLHRNCISKNAHSVATHTPLILLNRKTPALVVTARAYGHALPCCKP